jgi:ribosomal protein L11 methyltransferase
MTTQSFFILSIHGILADFTESITAICFEHGALGTEENLRFVQGGREYEPTTINSDVVDLKVYFGQPPSPQMIEVLLSVQGDLKIQTETGVNKDWLAEWKKGFHAFSLVDDVWVVPSWETPSAGMTKVIRIDPGMAFGTGTHETTQLAAMLVNHLMAQGAVSKIQIKKIESAADIGTGTGILGLLAAIYGAKNVIANDIDEDARRVARENVDLHPEFKNTVQVMDESVEQINGKFDLVIANIIDGVLVKIQKDLKRIVVDSGFLILTGILQEREELFLAEFDFSGFEIQKRVKKGEWLGFLLKRNL